MTYSCRSPFLAWSDMWYVIHKRLWWIFLRLKNHVRKSSSYLKGLFPNIVMCQSEPNHYISCWSRIWTRFSSGGPGSFKRGKRVAGDISSALYTSGLLGRVRHVDFSLQSQMKKSSTFDTSGAWTCDLLVSNVLVIHYIEQVHLNVEWSIQG